MMGRSDKQEISGPQPRKFQLPLRREQTPKTLPIGFWGVAGRWSLAGRAFSHQVPWLELFFGNWNWTMRV